MTSIGAAMDIRFGASVEEFMSYVTDIGLDHVEFKREYLAGHPDTPTPEEVRELAASYDVIVTDHAPFRDWNLGSYNETVRQNAVDRVKQTLDDAATAGATGVVVHGGSVPHRYPEWIRERAAESARRSLRACAEYAQSVGVPLCLENQPPDPQQQRYTTSPDALAAMLDAIDVPAPYLGVTLDVGHAKLTGDDWRAFVDRFGDRIRVCHLHDNDGTADQHEPLPDHDRFLDSVPADFFVFETVSVPDIARSAGVSPPPFTPTLQSTG